MNRSLDEQPVIGEVQLDKLLGRGTQRLNVGQLVVQGHVQHLLDRLNTEDGLGEASQLRQLT